jgi:hypothetical protein
MHSGTTFVDFNLDFKHSGTTFVDFYLDFNLDFNQENRHNGTVPLATVSTNEIAQSRSFLNKFIKIFNLKNVNLIIQYRENVDKHKMNLKEPIMLKVTKIDFDLVLL